MACQLPVVTRTTAITQILPVGSQHLMTVRQTPELTEVEMVEILKGIAREGSNAAARIAAIKELRAIRRGEKPSDDGLANLYEFRPRRSGNA